MSFLTTTQNLMFMANNHICNFVVLARGERCKALAMLLHEFRDFAPYNRSLCRQAAALLTLDDFRYELVTYRTSQCTKLKIPTFGLCPQFFFFFFFERLIQELHIMCAFVIGLKSQFFLLFNLFLLLFMNPIALSNTINENKMFQFI